MNVVEEENPSRPKRSCVMYNLMAPEKATRVSQRSQKGQGRRKKSSQICLFTEEEQDKSQLKCSTLSIHRPPLTPPVPCLQDSTTYRGGVLDSIPIDSESMKQNAAEEEFSHGGLHHHDDGIGRRLCGFGTPPFDLGDESSSSPRLEMTIPDSVEHTHDISSRPGHFNQDHLKELNALQSPHHDDRRPSSPASSPVADMINTLLGARHGGDYRYTSEERNVRMEEDKSDEDGPYTHQRTIRILQRNHVRVIEEDEENHDSRGVVVRGPQNAPSGLVEGNGHSNVIVDNSHEIHGHPSNRVQQNLDSNRNEGDEHPPSNRQQHVETGDNSNSRSEPFSLNKHGGRTSTLVSALVGEEKQQRKEYEKMRKRRWRASKATLGIHMRGCQTTSISLMTKPRLKLFEGMPYGKSHVVLVRELSSLIRAKLKSFRYANSITNQEFLNIHTLLHEKYENGNELLLHWTELQTKSLLRTWRKSVRKVVQEHLSTLYPDAQNPPPPLGVSEEEMLEFSKELADEDFKQKKSDMLDRSKHMVTKRGCANPMGKGGLCKANTHYIVTKGRLPSDVERQAWKDAANAAYTTKARANATIGQRENNARNPRDENQLIANMGPDWNHPFRGPKAFFDKFVEINGKDPTDAEISTWLTNGRPALIRPGT